MFFADERSREWGAMPTDLQPQEPMSTVLISLLILTSVGAIFLGFLFYLTTHEYGMPFGYYARGPVLIAIGALILIVSTVGWARSQEAWNSG